MNGIRLLLTMGAMLALLAVVSATTVLGANAPNPGGRAMVLALTPVGTGFTYQGRLTDAGSPANAPYDFRFILYDAESGGSQVGTTQNVNDLQVTNGLFTTTLDFGGTAFDGNARWLEIALRPGASTGTYTALSPRQPITAVPYAMYAKTAGLALPFSGSGASTGVIPLIDITQTAAGIAIAGRRTASDVSLSPAVYGVSAGAGAGVQGESTGTGPAGYFNSQTGSGPAGWFIGSVTAIQMDGALKVSGTNPTAFVHTVDAASITAASDCGGNTCTRINNVLTNGDPNALLFVILTQPGVGDNSPVAVNYAGGFWRIANQDPGVPMVAGMKFNVLVIKR